MEEYSKTPFVIVGTGAEARIALDIANKLEVVVFGFLADDEASLRQEINDVLVVTTLESKDAKTLLEDSSLKIVIADKDIGNRKDIVSLFESNDNELVSLIHPHSSISPYAKIGRGNLMAAGTVIEANSMVGSYNLFGNYVSIEPDVEMGDYCNVQSGVRIGAGAMIESAVNIGMGAVIYPGVKIGLGAVVGAGSIVLQDVAEGSQVFGNPAKAI